VFKNILKRKRLPFVGEFADAFFTTLPFFSIYSSLSITIILYAQVSDWLLVWLPWMTLWKFILIVGFALSIVLFLSYKYIIPSLWHSRSQQMSHLENKIDRIIKELARKPRKRNGITVAVSGGFDPLHPGHLAYIKEALKLGDYLLVILTRDEQLIEKDRVAGNKKNRLPIPYDVRKSVLEWGLGNRGEVVMNIDEDITSCKSLGKYHPNIFAKGGDSWDLDNLPEKSVCDELGIKIVFGVGGYDKPYSSSKLGVGVK